MTCRIHMMNQNLTGLLAKKTVQTLANPWPDFIHCQSPYLRKALQRNLVTLKLVNLP